MRSPISARLREMVWLRRKPARHIITVHITNQEFGVLKWCWMGKPVPTVVNLSQLLAGVSVLGGRGDRRGRRHPHHHTANKQGSSWKRDKGLSKLIWQIMQSLVEVKREKLAESRNQLHSELTSLSMEWLSYSLKKKAKEQKNHHLWGTAYRFNMFLVFVYVWRAVAQTPIYRMSAELLGVIQLCKLFDR